MEYEARKLLRGQIEQKAEGRYKTVCIGKAFWNNNTNPGIKAHIEEEHSEEIADCRRMVSSLEG